MATYTYICVNKDCSDFETVKTEKQGMNDKALIKCPICLSSTYERRILKAPLFGISGIGVYNNGTQ